METKKCPNCQNNVPVTVEKCPNCDFDLSKEYKKLMDVHQEQLKQALKPGYSNTSETIPENTIISGEGKYSLAGIVCIVLGFLFLGIGGFFIIDFISMKLSFPAIRGFGYLPIAIPMVIIGITLVIIGRIISKSEITITNKRVIGKMPFAKNLDIPLNSIYSAFTKGLKTISIQIGYKEISFHGVSNYEQILIELNRLLSENKTQQTN